MDHMALFNSLIYLWLAFEAVLFVINAYNYRVVIIDEKFMALGVSLGVVGLSLSIVYLNVSAGNINGSMVTNTLRPLVLFVGLLFALTLNAIRRRCGKHDE